VTARFDRSPRDRVILLLKRSCCVNEDVCLQAAKQARQIAVVSIECHGVFGREAHRPRGESRPPQMSATEQDSHRGGRSKCGGDTVAKKSIAAQHEDRAHQIAVLCAPSLQRLHRPSKTTIRRCSLVKSVS